MTTAAVQIPGYVTGTWTIDSVHSEVSFVVRHMMVSKVRGRFDAFDGTFTTASDPLQSAVTATVDLSSVNTGNETRDNHIRSEDFFDIEKHPTMTFRSTGVRAEGENFLLDGDLTLHGCSKLGPDRTAASGHFFGHHRDRLQRLGTATTVRSPASPTPWSSATRSRSI
jgi:polyisoprenoid-binding protein YceI